MITKGDHEGHERRSRKARKGIVKRVKGRCQRLSCFSQRFVCFAIQTLCGSEATDRQYDIVTTDATHPTNASSWTLFSTEFYRQVEQISRYWIMNSEQLREFAGQGDLVRDNDAFFLPINAETENLIGIIQLAAMRANP